jgi:cholesterol oxidase
MLSFMWGTGWPAMYHHHNLDPITHRRIGDLLGGTTLTFHRHALKMIRAGGRAVKFDPDNPKYDRLPDDYFARAAEIETPILFVTGGDNRIFTDSNIRCYEQLERVVPGRHQLHVFDGYGHADVFMGKNAHVDVFPRFLAFLEERSGRRPIAEAASVRA